MIHSGEGQSLFFTPIEALMLLEILKAEEVKLKNLADKALPLPFKIKVDTYGLTPVALKIKRQLQLPFIYLFLKLNVSFYDFFVYANGR